MVRSWTLVRRSLISNYIRLIQSIICTISLLFWIIASITSEKMFDHLHLILILPSRIRVDGKPFGGKANPLGSCNRFTTKVWCPNAMLTTSSNKLMTIHSRLLSKSLNHNSFFWHVIFTEKGLVNECWGTKFCSFYLLDSFIGIIVA
jgi:hypothetical protein